MPLIFPAREDLHDDAKQEEIQKAKKIVVASENRTGAVASKKVYAESADPESNRGPMD